MNGDTLSLSVDAFGGFKLSKVPKGPGAKLLKLDSGEGLLHTS